MAVVVWLTFGQTIGHDFVNYDDDVYVYHNAEVVRGLTFDGLIWAFTHVYAANWHPITWISHMIDCELWGIHPAGHHFTNVLLHSVGAVLLFLVLRAMTGAMWPSAFVAAVFAAHPLHVESVAWVTERKDVLSGIFFFLTFATYAHYVRRPKSVHRYLLVVATLALGLMCKPTLVTTPFVLLLLDYWPLRRFPQQHSGQRRVQEAARTSLSKILLEKLPLLILCAVSSGATVLAQKYNITTASGLPFGVRVENALVSYVIYLWQMLWPTRLAVLYPYPENGLRAWQLGLSLALLATITFAVFAWRKKRPYLLTGWFWYIGMLVPMIGLVQVGFQTRADRYTYLPQIGLYIMAAWGVGDALARFKHRQMVLWPAASVILLLFAASAYWQCQYWRNSESLWIHALNVTSGNAVAHNNLGNFYLDHNRLDEALRQYQASLSISEPTARRTNKIGLMERAYADAENNLGLTLTKQGQTHEGVACFERVLARFPDNPKAHLNIGNVLLDEGRTTEAIEHYKRALVVHPHYVDAHFNLGNAFAQREDVDRAIGEYEQALKIQPDLVDAQNNLAIAFLKKGLVKNAVTHWREALRIQPNSVDILNNLAWILATFPDPSLRDGRKAVALAEHANSLSANKKPEILRTVAAAYAEAGNFSTALQEAEQGAELARAQPNRELAEILDADAVHYRKNEPLRTAPTYP
jgi:tetratricopeptide (TPR) repeat protein